MNKNNNFWPIAGVIVGILSFIGFCINWYENRHKPTILEVKTISEIELTRPLNVEHLSFSYLYDSIPVEHLWQSAFVITNVGETTLYGEGFEDKNIKGESLLIHLVNCDNLLSIEKVDGNTDAMLQDKSLRFNQWRPNEYIELRIIADGPEAPELQINEREIKEGEIIYTKYSPDEKPVVKRWIDYLPLSLSKALWWVVIILYIIIALFSMISAVQQYRKAEDKTTRTITLVVWIIIFIFMLAPLLWMFQSYEREHRNGKMMKHNPSCLCSEGLKRMAKEFKRFPEQYEINFKALLIMNNDILSRVNYLILTDEYK